MCVYVCMFVHQFLFPPFSPRWSVEESDDGGAETEEEEISALPARIGGLKGVYVFVRVCACVYVCL